MFSSIWLNFHSSKRKKNPAKIISWGTISLWEWERDLEDQTRVGENSELGFWLCPQHCHAVTQTSTERWHRHRHTPWYCLPATENKRGQMGHHWVWLRCTSLPRNSWDGISMRQRALQMHKISTAQCRISSKGQNNTEQCPVLAQYLQCLC